MPHNTNKFISDMKSQQFQIGTFFDWCFTHVPSKLPLPFGPFPFPLVALGAGAFGASGGGSGTGEGSRVAACQ